MLCRFLAVLLLISADAVRLTPKRAGKAHEAKLEVEAKPHPVSLMDLLSSARPSSLLQKLGLSIDPDAAKDEELQVIPAGPTTEKEMKEMAKEARAKLWATLKQLVIYVSFYILAVAAGAYIYKRLWAEPVLNMDKAKDDLGDQEFAHGPWSCLEDMHVCILSFCCMPCRFAATTNATGILGYWAAVALFVVLVDVRVLIQDRVVWLLVYLLGAGICTYYRQKLRSAFNLQNTSADQAKDFFMWACCCCCAVSQEARQVRAAAKLQV